MLLSIHYKIWPSGSKITREVTNEIIFVGIFKRFNN